jgi:hypothetical protein
MPNSKYLARRAIKVKRINVISITMLIFLSIILTIARRADAELSKLLRIPTIDIVCDGSYYLDFGVDGKINDLNNSYKYICSEFGYSDRFEAGVDIDLDDLSRSLINAKYLVFSDEDRKYGVALGVYDITSDRVSTPYIVTAYTISDYRVHLGAMRQDRKTRFFTGIEGNFGDKFILKADHIEGEGNVSAVGLGYNINDRTGLTLGHIFSNTGGEGLIGLEFSRQMSEQRGLTASVTLPDRGGDMFFSILLTNTCSYKKAKTGVD